MSGSIGQAVEKKDLAEQFKMMSETLKLETYIDNDYGFERDFHAGKDNNTTHWVDLDNGHSLGLLAIFPEASLDQLVKGNLPRKYIALIKDGVKIESIGDFVSYAWSTILTNFKKSYENSLRQREDVISNYRSEMAKRNDEIAKRECEIAQYDDKISELTNEIKELTIEYEEKIKDHQEYTAQIGLNSNSAKENTPEEE